MAYVLLASVYLIYLPHAQFVLDDWFVLGRYEAGEVAQTALAIVQNRFHGQFRFQWLSFLMGYGLWLVVGYSPKAVFLTSLALHAGCATALRGALEKLGVGTREAFWAGALFLLLPTTHGALLWSFNCAFFLWSTLWFLLYLREVAAEGPLWRQTVFLLLALFSGDPVFGLLLVAPVVAWRGWRPVVVGWGTLAVAAVAYATLVNRVPVFQAGLNVRYQFTLHQALATLAIIGNVYRKMTGLPADSYFRLAAVGSVRWWWRWRWLAVAVVLWGAAYGPILFLRAHEFRYDYVPSAYLALGLAVITGGRWVLGAVLAGWLALATVGDIGQSWIPQSQRLRLIEEKLRSLDVARGDTIVVSGTVMWIGTAPHFAFLAEWASTPFAEHVTGVKGLETACDIAEEGGALRLRHRNYQRDWKLEEAGRTRVLVVDKEGRLEEKKLLARPVGHGKFRLYGLKGYRGPGIPGEAVGREQMAMLEQGIYFVERDVR